MDEALIKRVLPHSIEAEQAVVGAMLMDRDAILTSSEIISGEDFYQTAYGVIFEAVVEIYNEGKPVDLITLQSRLKEKDVPAEISSLEFVRDLVAAKKMLADMTEPENKLDADMNYDGKFDALDLPLYIKRLLNVHA